MRKSLLVVLSVILCLGTIFTACGGDSAEPSTAPTQGMDFSFDKNDVNGSYDESDVVSIIQGDPVVIPDESGEVGADTNSSETDVSDTVESKPAEDDSSAVESKPVEDDSSAVESKPAEDDSSAVESKPVEDDSSAVESKPAEDDSSAVESKPVEDDSSAVESKPVEDDSSAVESKPVEDDSSAVESKPVEDDSSTVESKPVEDNSGTAEPPAPAGDVYITTEGTHVLTGGFTNRKIIVELPVTKKATLVLDNVVINNANGPAIFVKEGDKVTITVKEGTTNVLSDGSSYSYTDGTTTVDGAIFSLADLTINGTGKLTVNGNYKHAVVSKDNLVIAGCTLTVNSKSTALNGKDCVKITGGTLKVTAGSNGIVSDNAESSTRGYIYFEGGTINVTAGLDGVKAETVIKSNNTSITVKAGGGSVNPLGTTTQSYKAMKATSDILISGGTYVLDSRDDCLNSNNTVNITGGTLTLSSSAKGIRAGADISVSGGTLTITKSYEGIEARRVLISNGTVSVTSEDDGLNAINTTNAKGDIIISGGYVFLNVGNGSTNTGRINGIDTNGTMTISGGVVLISGSANSGNGIIEYGSLATVTGGVFVALGTADNTPNFNTAQNQGSMLCSFATQGAGTSFAVCDSNGKVVASFKNPKSYQCALVTAPGIQSGNTYTLVAGATIAGVDANGFAQNTTKTGGTVIATVNMTSNLN